MKRLNDVDPEIANAIRLETERQAFKLELIASRSFNNGFVQNKYRVP